MKTKHFFLTLTALGAGLASSSGQIGLIRQPADLSVSLGATATFQVLATGTSLLYQWRFNEAEILSATNRTLIVTNVQLANAGGYQVVVSNLSGSTNSRVALLDVDATFTKLTTVGIPPVGNVGVGLGSAWGDYDNDGFIDLIITSEAENVGVPQKNVLFHNNGNGTFTRVTNSVVSLEGRDWRGCTWVDYDNDGNLDLFVTSTDANGFPSQNELFRNNGDGTFTKMTASEVGAIVSTQAGGSEGPVWADYDGDGFLDVFVARYGPDWLLHNDGSGFFTSVTNGLNGAAQEDSYVAVWGDFNNDGRPDLFVACKSEPPTNRFYLNLGGGAFQQVTSGSIVTNRGHSWGCACADYDNDGYLDLYVSNGQNPNGEANFLYHNNGDGSFTRMTSVVVGSIASDTGPFGQCAWGDYDNDGFLDLFVAGLGGRNVLYRNNGDGSFSRILKGSLVNDTNAFAASPAWGDYDNDGFLDLFVSGDGPGAETDVLYHNNGNSNTWLKFKLVGTASNRSAIGAKVRVQATIGGRTFWQMREINTGCGFATGPLEAHFGLGDATRTELVRIEWPSGIVQTLTNVAARQFLTVVEHQERQTSPPPRPPAFNSATRSAGGAVDMTVVGETGLLYLFEASSDLLNWTKVGVRSNATSVVAFTDTRATNYVHRFYRVSAP